MTKTHSNYSTWSLIPILLFFLAVGVLLFSRSMNRRFSHDEHQFVASGVLLAEEGLFPYQDFPYHHTPYLTYVNALIFNFADRLLFSARTASVAFSVLGAGVIYYFVLEAFTGQRRLLRHLPAAGSGASF